MESRLLTRLTASSIVVDSIRSEMLPTYGDVIKFLLPMYEMDEIVAKTYNDVFSFRLGSALSEEAHFRVL